MHLNFVFFASSLALVNAAYRPRIRITDTAPGTYACWGVSLTDIGNTFNDKVIETFPMLARNSNSPQDIEGIRVALSVSCNGRNVPQLHLKGVVKSQAYADVRNVNDVVLVAAIDTITKFSSETDACIHVTALSKPNAGLSGNNYIGAYVWSRYDLEFTSADERMRFLQLLRTALWKHDMAIYTEKLSFWNFYKIPIFGDTSYSEIVENILQPGDLLRMKWEDYLLSGDFGKRFLLTENGSWKGKLCPQSSEYALTRLEDRLIEMFEH